MFKTFSSKLILFGEYSLLVGSDALAVPYRKQFGYFEQSALPMDSRLIDWLNFLEQQKVDFLDLNEMRSDFMGGMRFISNIEQGYGMGSSGALCAASYEKYRLDRDENDLHVIKEQLSKLEDCFHQDSSGIDPLVSYLDSEILLRDDQWQPIPDIDCDPSDYGMFLLDTGRPRKTSPLVQVFRNMIQNEEFLIELKENYIPSVNEAIGSYLREDEDVLYQKMDQISRWQSEHFKAMIPNFVLPLFHQGIDKGSYRLKLCGAGGGGYFLGMSINTSKTKKELAGQELIWL